MAKSEKQVLETRLSVRLTPRAAQNSVQRYESGVLYLRLTAPPVEGAANEACCRYVAEILDVGKSDVTLTGGQKSRNKVLTIAGLSAEQVAARLMLHAPPDGTSSS